MNTVNLTGRLTRDPELRSTSGTTVGKMRVALGRPKDKNGEDAGADYVDVTVFGRQAEVCAEFLATGRRIGVEGRLSHSEWDAEDGSHRQKLEVIARHVEFLDGSRRQDSDPEPERVPVGVSADDDIPF
ncbi:MAG: single-stranded DNA-binding protein [Actinomycetota bacterium]|nr:single-stranded DNA-binding protein [Actinomycetota bacterium]